jgi:uncharacterized protein YecT (DUF1311 family)
MLHRATLIATFAALLAASAQAETYPLGDLSITIPQSPTYRACFERAAGRDLDMAVCSSAEVSGWDRRLNAAYARLRRVLPPPDFAVLQAFQRAWIAERDAACRDDGQSGTAGRMEAATCRLRMTAIRAAELETRAQ